MFNFPEFYTAGSEVSAFFAGYPIDLQAAGAVIIHSAELIVFKQPVKTEYNTGESFSPTGMIPVVRYDDGTTDTLAAGDVEFTVSDPLTEADSSVTVSWRGLTVGLPIKVFSSRRVSRIEIAEPPDNIKYITGQSLSIAGIKVNIYYEGETAPEEADVSKLKTVPELGSPVTAGMKSFTVRYELSPTVYYDAKQPIQVESKTAIALAVTSKPNKTVYTEGDSFNPAGMVISLLYNDTTLIPVTGYETQVDDPFLLSSNDAVQQKTVKFSYSGFECSLTITVNAKKVKSLSILSAPTKTVYRIGETFDPAGMKVLLNYAENGSTPVIVPDTAYSYAPTGKLTAADTSIYISFRGLTEKVDIEVNASGVHVDDPVTSESATAAPPVTADPGTVESSDDVPGTSAPDYSEPVDPSSSEPAGDETKSPSVTTKSSGGGKKQGGFDTVMLLWIGIIALIVIALVLLIIYYKRHCT